MRECVEARGLEKGRGFSTHLLRFHILSLHVTKVLDDSRPKRTLPRRLLQSSPRRTLVSTGQGVGTAYQNTGSKDEQVGKKSDKWHMPHTIDTVPITSASSRRQVRATFDSLA
jgi:hypothetical protein